MNPKKRYTTVALAENQHLVLYFTSSIVEWYCKGFTNGKRDKTLDGHYFKKELTVKGKFPRVKTGELAFLLDVQMLRSDDNWNKDGLSKTGQVQANEIKSKIERGEYNF